MKKAVIRPVFVKQLDKRPVDKEVNKIKQASQEQITMLKASDLGSEKIERKINEIAESTKYRVSLKYQHYYDQRLNIAKGNIASFYSQLYRAIFGGHILRRFKTEKESYQNGDEDEQRNFHPDQIRYEDGRKILCEIKAVSSKNAKPFCSSNQLENYCHDMLTSAFKTMFASEIEYAFFRYFHRSRDGTEKRTSVLANWELKRKLARDTRDLLIVPSNLLFLMFLLSNGDWLNQKSNKGPDQTFYWKVYGNLISLLHKHENPVISLIENLEQGIEFARGLCLEDLSVVRNESPKNIYCCGKKVRHFPVTRYYNRTERWLEYFKQSHQRILTDGLGIRDLYDELRRLPF